MNNDRLLKLADLLEADAKNKKGIKFDFLNWGLVADTDKPMSCGTRACAMGLAALSGAFKRQGLTCRVKSTGAIVISHSGTSSPIRAAARLFNIKEFEAVYLFASSWELPEVSGAAAERAVAKRIRKFVAGKASPSTV